MDELDTKPTLENLCTNADRLVSRKAPENDGIPLNLIKCCKSVLLHSICGVGRKELFHKTREMLKFSRSTNPDYRSDASKCCRHVFACIILVRLQRMTECVYTVSHRGFRAERSTVDVIFFILFGICIAEVRKHAFSFSKKDISSH